MEKLWRMDGKVSRFLSKEMMPTRAGRDGSPECFPAMEQPKAQSIEKAGILN
jgi:hypothetical protein